MRLEISPADPVTQQLRPYGLNECGRFWGVVWLYRFLSAEGSLLYIGVTANAQQRWGRHRRIAPWWPRVSTVDLEPFRSMRDALGAEVCAIKTEAPLFNARSAVVPRTGVEHVRNEQRPDSAVVPHACVSGLEEEGIGRGRDLENCIIDRHSRNARGGDAE